MRAAAVCDLVSFTSASPWKFILRDTSLVALANLAREDETEGTLRGTYQSAI